MHPESPTSPATPHRRTFPTVDALQTFGGGSRDVFAAKLSADGAALLFSTFLGGNDFETAEGMAIDAAGNLYLAGNGRGNFPTVSPDPAGPLQPAALGNTDGIIAKIQTIDDAEGPIITSLSASPNPVEVNSSSVSLAATADDSTTGDSPIADVEYSIDGGTPVSMNPSDGTFDTSIEDAEALIGPFAETGIREICVTRHRRPRQHRRRRLPAAARLRPQRRLRHRRRLGPFTRRGGSGERSVRNRALRLRFEIPPRPKHPRRQSPIPLQGRRHPLPQHVNGLACRHRRSRAPSSEGKAS